MERELKFRVWDNFEKKYLTLDEYQQMGCIHVENDGTLSFSGDYRFTLSMMIQMDKYKVEQYTGLKDKYGKEIYEGDILRDYGNDIEDWVVSYEDGGFVGTFDNICEHLFELTDMEIVGNVNKRKETNYERRILFSRHQSCN